MPMLALRGGSPVIKSEMLPRWPQWGNEEQQALTQVLHSGRWWRGGYEQGSRFDYVTGVGMVHRFERAFADFIGVPFALATTSGTVGLELCFKSLDLQPDDEVIIPAYGVICTASAVLAGGGKIVFADVQADNCNICPACIEACISNRTRAIVAVHFGGVPCNMNALLTLAKKYGVSLVEDAAHAHGSEWRGTKVGSFGTAGVFSFHNSKNMTCGEGGMVVTHDMCLFDRVKSLHDNGRGKHGAWYNYVNVGTNARMTEFQAAIGLTQLDRLMLQMKLRESNVRYFLSLIRGIPGLTSVVVPPEMTACSYHIVVLKYDQEQWGGLPRHRFLFAVNAEGLPCSAGYPAPLAQCKALAGRSRIPNGCHVAEQLCRREAIWLDHSLFLADRVVVEKYATVFDKIRLYQDELKR